MVLCAGYSLWLHNRLNAGTLKHKYIYIFTDITSLETYLFIAMSFGCLLIGVYPKPILELLHISSTLTINV